MSKAGFVVMVNSMMRPNLSIQKKVAIWVREKTRLADVDSLVAEMQPKLMKWKA